MDNKMKWTNCFSPKRYGSDYPDEGPRSTYERDWDRIIFSSSFRRLQNKTQVFPLPEEVFVHNRLTHSLEVASVGRSLGKAAGRFIAELPEVENNDKARSFYRNNLKNVVAAACLAHDLGNPAFGHSGEEAISKFFRSKNQDEQFKKRFSEAEWQDLTNFEGNANALRILTLQRNGKAAGSFRLTYSTMGSIIKYPCESLASEGNKGRKHLKKYGYFKVDEAAFLKIAKELNMIADNKDGKVCYKRHPFVYLVEAADDICYNIIDLEDAHRLGIIPYETVRKLFSAIILTDTNEEQEYITSQLEQLETDKNEAMSFLRAKSINTLTLKCTRVFKNNVQKIIEGEYDQTLIDDIPELQQPLEDIKELSNKEIYNFKGVVKLELAGFRIMSGLVEDFVIAALTPVDKRQKEHKKILELLPSQFNFNENDPDYVKVMHIIDFISGMTDLFALKLYRNLRGIEI